MNGFRWHGSARSLGLATLIGLTLVGSAVARPHIDHEYQFTERQLEKARQRVAQLEARLEELGEERARSSATPPPPNCDDPFVFDSNGIKRWRDECSQQSVVSPQPAKARACDMPFRVDQDGIKHVQLECVSRFE
jgi:hypothetical protein